MGTVFTAGENTGETAFCLPYPYIFTFLTDLCAAIPPQCYLQNKPEYTWGNRQMSFSHNVTSLNSFQHFGFSSHSPTQCLHPNSIAWHKACKSMYTQTKHPDAEMKHYDPCVRSPKVFCNKSSMQMICTQRLSRQNCPVFSSTLTDTR